MRIVVAVLFALFLNIPSIHSESKHFHLPNKCATFLPEEKKKITQSFILNDDFRPKLDNSHSSVPGNFLIHYDIVGKHAVPLKDNDQNGVPDYVDSVAYYFEYVYAKQVVEMGYISPIPDSGSGGSYQYDIYLIELGDSLGWYGYTEQEIQTNSDEAFPTFLSFIVIDNDYSEKDSILNYNDEKVPTYNTLGIEAMKITAAHEFYHAIQFMYGSPIGIGLAAEMTSTFMETHIFPEIDDYLQYLRNYLNYPFLFSFASGGGITGYQFVGFAMFLDSKYEAGFFKRFWEVLSERNRTFQTIEILMEEFEFDFNTDWLEFAEWVYHTGSRAVPDMYFKHAARLPEIHFERDTSYTDPSFMHSSSIGAYMFEAYRITFENNENVTSGIVDILITNTDFAKGLVQSDTKDDFTILCRDEFETGSEKLDIGCYYKLMTQSENLVDIIYQYHDGNTEKIEYPFPQPYEYGIDDILHFPVPLTAGLKEKVTIVIYDIAMKSLFKSDREVNVVNGKRVILVNDLPNDIKSGIYIFQVVNENDSIVGKFTVK